MYRHMSHITQRPASFSTIIKKKVWTREIVAVSMKLKGDRSIFDETLKDTYLLFIQIPIARN